MKCDALIVPTTGIVGTYHWTIQTESGDTEEVDLLACFTEVAQQVVAECGVREDQVYHDALQCIERFKKARNGLGEGGSHLSSSRVKRRGSLLRIDI